MAFDKFFDWLFSPIVNNMSSLMSVIVITFLITLVITFIYKLMTDQKLMKSLKKEIKDMQKQMKSLKDNPAKLMDLQKELMQKNAQMMKHSLKPTFITLLPILLVFGWLRSTYVEAGELLHWGFKLPLFGTGFGWLGTYILFAVIFSMFLRKIMKVH